MAIKDHYKSLNPSEKTDFIYHVCKLLDISIPAFQKKLFSRGFKKIEEELVQERIINKQA